MNTGIIAIEQTTEGPAAHSGDSFGHPEGSLSRANDTRDDHSLRLSASSWRHHLHGVPSTISTLTSRQETNAPKAQLINRLLRYRAKLCKQAACWCFVQSHGSCRMNGAPGDRARSIVQAATCNSVSGLYALHLHHGQQALQLDSRASARPPHLSCQVRQLLVVHHPGSHVTGREKACPCFLMVRKLEEAVVLLF